MFNLARRKKAKERSDTEIWSDQMLQMEILDTERRLQEVISPVESYIMMTQSILVWENPQYTSVMFVCANILFWLATTTPIYRLVGLTGIVVVFLDMWTNKIWPEIRVPPPADHDSEGWTPVHPRLLSVPELCHHGAVVWVTSSHRIQWVVKLRKQHHAKFFFLMVIVLGSSAVLGTYISGIMFLYIIVMGCLLLPGIVYHQLPQKAFQRLEPVIHRIEKYFNVKRKRTKRAKKKGRRALDTSRSSIESDSDAELCDMMPSFDISPPATSSAKAARSDTDEESATGLTPGRVTPGGGLTDLSDDDASFMPQSSMPRFDDSRLDESFSDQETFGTRLHVPDVDKEASDSDLDLTLTRGDDEPLEADDELDSNGNDKPTKQAHEAMLFKESHFKEDSNSSDSEETGLLKGLAMPGIDDEDVKEEPEGFIGQLTQQVAAAVTGEAVSEKMTTLMSSTMFGLSKLSETVRGAVQGAAGGGSPAKEGRTEKEEEMMESLDSDILAEFDFLDDEDMGDDDENDGTVEPKPPKL